MIEQLNINGRLKLEKISNGNIEIIQIPNTIVSVGKAQIAGLIISDLNVGSAYDWMSLGLGSSTIAASNTILGSEYLKVGLGSVTGSTTTTTTTNDTARFIGSFAITATKIINEAGLFNKSGLNLGSMLARTTFAGITVNNGDQINATWDIIFS